MIEKDRQRFFVSGLRQGQPGFSLVELMIALALGLIVVGAVISIFLSNKQSYSTNQALAEIQDNARVAFELIARDTRQAGLTGCGNFNRVANVLNNAPTAIAAGSGQPLAWWADFTNNAFRGYDGNMIDPAVSFGTATARRLNGTSSLQLIGAGTNVYTVANSNNPDQILVNGNNVNFQSGDVFIVCDNGHAAIAQITQITAGTPVTLRYAANAGNPGNCAGELGFPPTCGSGIRYTFGGPPPDSMPNAPIAVLQAEDWYVGNNGQGGQSLYRIALTNTGGVAAPGNPQEMVRNISQMQLTYHVSGASNFVNAAGVGANWGLVDAMRIALTLVATDRQAGTTAGQQIQRTLATTVALRNRLQ